MSNKINDIPAGTESSSESDDLPELDELKKIRMLRRKVGQEGILCNR